MMEENQKRLCGKYCFWCAVFVTGILLLVIGVAQIDEKDLARGICLTIAGGGIIIGMWIYGLLGCP